MIISPTVGVLVNEYTRNPKGSLFVKDNVLAASKTSPLESYPIGNEYVMLSADIGSSVAS